MGRCPAAPVLPIDGEVSGGIGPLSSPFMGRCPAEPDGGAERIGPCPPHSWGGVRRSRTEGQSENWPVPISPVLDRQALNRALLARQLLLQRRPMSAAAAVEHLVGMQAQAPNLPYVGLWSRLRGFRHEELSRLVATRKAVRLSLMRNTIHLVTARDAFGIKPLFMRL